MNNMFKDNLSTSFQLIALHSEHIENNEKKKEKPEKKTRTKMTKHLFRAKYDRSSGRIAISVRIDHPIGCKSRLTATTK